MLVIDFFESWMIFTDNFAKLSKDGMCLKLWHMHDLLEFQVCTCSPKMIDLLGSEASELAVLDVFFEILPIVQ